VDRVNQDHISSVEIDSLLGVIPGAGGEPDGRPLEELSRHLFGCDACAQLLERHRLAQKTLGEIRVNAPHPRGIGCPPEECWPSLAAGLPVEDGDAALAHAATCGHCSELMNSALLSLRNDPTPEEEAFLDRLSVDLGDLARRLQASAPRVLPRRDAFSRIWAMAASVLVAAAAGWWMYHRINAAPLTLLSDAYAARRTMDLRIAAAPFAPEVAIRGSARPPAALLDAQAALASHFERHSQDPQWLHARGLADLLSGKYGEAVDSLLQANRIQPESADIAIDLAVGLAQKGRNEGRAADLESAETTLNGVLARQPENPPACFDRALVREDRQEGKLALEDWEHYLQLDGSSGWAGEAREHAERIRTSGQ